MITRHLVAEKIAAWLHHEIPLESLVDWAESAIALEPIEDQDPAELAAILGRLGLADVRSFGLSWQDCEDLLRRLGYTVHVEISAG